MNRIAVLIMAAGNSSRFQECKQLARFGKSTILQHAIDTANRCLHENHSEDIYVVTGSYHDKIANRIQRARLIYNPQWQKGLGVSIAHGVSKITDQYNGVLIMLADQVAITTVHLEQLIEHFHGENIVCAHYQENNGVPAIFPSSCFDYLRKLHNDKGAKKLLNMQSDELGQELISIDIPQAAIDIDTPDDLIKISKANVKYHH